MGYILSACSKVETDDIVKAFAKQTSSYQSENIDDAEMGLMELCKTLKHWQAHGVTAVDFNHSFGILESRLYVLYSEKGILSSAKEHFNLATNYLTVARMQHGGTPKTYMESDIRNIVALADKDLHVRWLEK